MESKGLVQPAGDFSFRVIRSPAVLSAVPERSLSVREIIKYGFPSYQQSPEVRRWKHANIRHFWQGLMRYLASVVTGRLIMFGRLVLVVQRSDGRIHDLGLVGIAELVTTAGVVEVATRFAGTSAASIANFNFHGIGTGATAAAITDTALVTELTTQYATNSTRPTGTQSNPGSTNIYQTTATIIPDSAVAITEWGLFAQAATGGGTLLDRKVFSVVNLNGTGDSIVPTYQLTLPAGG